MLGIEGAALTDAAARARTAVHDDGGLAVGVAAHLPVDEVAVADVEMPMVIRLDRGMHRPNVHSAAGTRKRIPGRETPAGNASRAGISR
ncbi:hypothetical protein GCM10012278_44380 [Nonomuraea glycinis]|uniref:Uncharacterized protein n=1 Tax=Nonomuraea glycinis TaxID=2047744 RepID=A0A918A7C9_9ACTN|nr:hypothetical protein GCM10012278_44380 [Nonomuraea glycinis]